MPCDGSVDIGVSIVAGASFIIREYAGAWTIWWSAPATNKSEVRSQKADTRSAGANQVILLPSAFILEFMTKPVVLVTGTAITQDAQQPLREAGCEILFMKPPVDEPALLKVFTEHPVSVVILRGPAPFTPAVFDAAKHLKIISKHGAGIDSVDLGSATAHGVAVMVTNGANADAVAEHSLALMFALTRELPRYERLLRGGGWKDQGYQVRDFSERTVGIVGHGQIGSRTARLALACGAKVIVHSRRRAELPKGMEWEESLDGLLARADIVSLHTPLSGETRGMIGAAQLAKMKPTAFIVNTSRGKLIDEPALIAALKEGRIAGAGLDVFAQEPPDPQNPLFSMPNVIVTPHIASSTTGAARQMGVIGAQNILHYLRGEVYDERNFINPQVMKPR
jgi:D-3-phosphoglycerate dehydrogenase